MQLTTRQVEVAKRVARGMTTQGIADDMGLSSHTVAQHVRQAAARLPGDGWPRYKLMLFVLNIEGEDQR